VAGTLLSQEPLVDSFLSELIPVQMDALGATKGPGKSTRQDFAAAIRKAQSRLGVIDFQKTRSRQRPQRSATAQGTEKVEKKKAPDVTTVSTGDFAPLALLLQASGIPSERTTVFFNSLNADYPGGKVPMEDLLARVRTLMVSELGGKGQVQLVPKSRLALESGLTQWGLSPKEADRVLSLSSNANGEVDAEKFLKIAALNHPSRSAILNRAPGIESEPWKAGTAGRADSTGNLQSSGIPEAQAKASEPIMVQFKKGHKLTPSSVHGGSEGKEQGVAGPERNKGSNEGNAPRRAAKEPATEEGRSSSEARSYEAAGPGPRLGPAKPTVSPARLLLFSEDPVPAHVVAQVSKQISRAVLGGDQTIRMHLHPPELGMVKVQVAWSQDALKIEMVTDRYQAKDLLLASMPELKEALGDQGFRVEKMEIVVNDPSGLPLSHSGREHRDASGAGARPQDEDGFLISEAKGDERPEQPLTSRAGHLLDLVA